MKQGWVQRLTLLGAASSLLVVQAVSVTDGSPASQTYGFLPPSNIHYSTPDLGATAASTRRMLGDEAASELSITPSLSSTSSLKPSTPGHDQVPFLSLSIGMIKRLKK